MAAQWQNNSCITFDRVALAWKKCSTVTERTVPTSVREQGWDQSLQSSWTECGSAMSMVEALLKLTAGQETQARWRLSDWDKLVSWEQVFGNCRPALLCFACHRLWNLYM